MIAGILLAAGRGVRFGGDKLLAPLAGAGGEAVGVVACRALAAALPHTIAVVRPGDHALAQMFRSVGARVVECASAGEGMGASLACGVRAAPDAQGWVVALADMPWIDVATIAAVRDAIAGGALLAAPFHRGRRGHPVGFGGACYAGLARSGGDEGARAVVQEHAHELLRIDVDDPGVLRDVDTPADLA